VAMKKKPTKESIPERPVDPFDGPFLGSPNLEETYKPGTWAYQIQQRLRKRLDEKNIPHPGISRTEQRDRIYKYFLKDMRKELKKKKQRMEYLRKGLDYDKLFHARFKSFWPDSSEELKLQGQFDLILGKYINKEDREFWFTLKEFINFVGTKISLPPRRYLQGISDDDEGQENLIERFGTDKTQKIEQIIDAQKFANIFLNYEVRLNDRMPLFYLIAIAIYADILPNMFNVSWFLPMEENLPRIYEYRSKMSFWEQIDIARFVSGLEDKKPPFFILKPPRENEKFRVLESFLSAFPQYYLKKLSWHYGGRYLKQLDQEYSVTDVISGRLIKGNLLRDLKNHPGVYQENRKAWDLYNRIMGDQGPIDKIQRPGLIHYLVEIISSFNDRRKYDLTSLFLKGYLGIKDITPEGIKAHLKPRKMMHK
jgi:hypothetical protein